MKQLAIVGSHPSGRKYAPWEDFTIPIWVLNDAGQKAPRCNAVIQIHDSRVYSDPLNYEPRASSAFQERKDFTFWEWMQNNRKVEIWMQQIDERVPMSKKYPLDEILEKLLGKVQQGRKELKPLRYITSGASAAIALALYQGYDKIYVYGIENALDSEYHKQQEGLMFWLGYAAGAGVDLEIHCLDRVFHAPIYGYQTNKGKNMILDNTARVNLLAILPPTGSITNMKIIRELKENLGFDEAERAEIGFIETPNADDPQAVDYRWEKDLMKDIPIGEVARKVITDAFTQVSDKGLITDYLLSLYEKISDG